MREDTTVQSIVRILGVIEVLNQRSVTTVDMMHQATEIPKPTLIRLLGTLVETGYVFHVSRRDGYALTEKVLRLSAGFHYHDAIVDFARPLLEAFTEKHKWQISLGTLDSDAMLVRFNTRRMSPFAPDQLYLNRRVGMLTSALGRAYLAYSSKFERDSIMRLLKASNERTDAAARHAKLVDTLIETVRRQGYATIERPPGDRVRSIAVPILNMDPTRSAIAAITMFYFSSAMTEAQATSRYLKELYEIGDQIARALGEMHEIETCAGDAQLARPSSRPSHP